MKNNELTKTRQNIVYMFLNSIKEEPLKWEKGWHSTLEFKEMYNGASNANYHGFNQLLLNFIASERGYEDPRWVTYKQAESKGWQVKNCKGMGVPIEFWSMYDKTNKKTISFSQYEKLMREGEREKNEFRIMAKCYCVFNAKHVEGIPELDIPKKEKLNDIEMNQFVNDIKNNMGVKYEERGSKAFYRPSEDIVVMPPREDFFTQHEFDSTLLHELSHATGHESRLKRDLSGRFGTPDYAVEELRAEMSAVFMSSYIDSSLSENEINNHKAYVQSWAEAVENNPDILIDAIKEGQKIADYMIDIGGLSKYIESQDENELEDDMEL